MIDFYKVLEKRLHREQNLHNLRAAQMLANNIINFGSNDYLGLKDDWQLCQSSSNAAQNQFGAGGAHLLGGLHAWHGELEQRLCAFTGYRAALIFSTAYMANLAICTALLQRGDSLIQDKLNHASLIDGGALAAQSGIHFTRYRHVDLNALSQRLQTATGNKLVLTDAVFSMDGDIAPLPEIIQICNTQHAILAVDDAHGFGVLGHGRGTLAHFGVDFSTSPLPISICAFGKAMGGFGAAILGDAIIIDTLRQFARTYLFTTASPPALARAHITALDIIEQQPWRQQALAANIQQLQSRAQQLNLPFLKSQTPIQPLLIGASDKAVALADKMLALGFYTPAVRTPSVPHNQARLRISLNSNHTSAQIDALLQNLAAELAKLAA